MTGRDLIQWIKDNHAEDLNVYKQNAYDAHAYAEAIDTVPELQHIEPWTDGATSATYDFLEDGGELAIVMMFDDSRWHQSWENIHKRYEEEARKKRLEEAREHCFA